MDAMAIVRAFGKPTLFITITCNPTWPETADALLPVSGQRTDRTWWLESSASSWIGSSRT